MATVAVASGKGGTGKTTVATNIAYTAARSGQCVTYLENRTVTSSCGPKFE
ncbi:MAG: P-loop NTPase [Armatimonadota bacterium]|nr:P-loop NTPase [Armatimonadota bacterium]